MDPTTEIKPVRSDGEGSSPRSGVAFAVVAAVLLTVTAGTSVATPLLSLFERTIGITPLEAVVLYACYSLGVIVALLASAVLADAVTLADRILGALLLAMLAAVMFSVTANFALLLVARVVSGFASGAVTSTATTAMMALGGSARRQRSAVIAVAANFSGLALGALLGGALSSVGVAPRELPFLVVAAVAAVLSACLVAIRSVLVDATRQTPSPPGTLWQRSLGQLEDSSKRVFVNAAIPSTVAFTANALVSAVAAFYVSHELGVSDRTVVGAVIAIGFLFTALGQLLVRALQSRSSQVLGRGILLVGTATLLAAMLEPSWSLLLAGSALIGAGTGVATGAGLASITGLADPRQTAGLTTRYFVVLYLGLFVPITALGVLEEPLGAIHGTVLACAACLVALASAFVAMRRFWRDHPAEASV